MSTSLKFFASAVLVACFAFFSSTASHAATNGTKEEATAMVKKAVAYVKQHGKEKAFAEFAKKDGQFVDRDLYVMVYDFNGKCLSHGANERLIGRTLIDLKDPDGKLLIKDMVELSRDKGRGWVDYKWTHPVTKSVDPKSTYVERVEDFFIGVGIYR
jgi:cytochrome c